MAKKSLWLITVDHPQKSKRQRLYRYFDKIGEQLSRSIYYIHTDRKSLQRIQTDIQKIAENSGKVNFIPVCRNCAKRAATIGANTADSKPDILIITGE